MTDIEGEPVARRRWRRRRPSIRKRMIRLVVTVLVLAGGWTAVWFTTAYYAKQMATNGYRSPGLTVGCKDPEVVGYPISIELTCQKTDAQRALGQSLSFAGIRASTSLSDPGGLTAEIASPAVLNPAPGLSVRADWSKARATAKLTPENLKRLEVEIDDFILKPAAALAGLTDLSLKRGTIELRQHPDVPADAEAFVAIDGLSGIRPGVGDLDMRLALRLPDGAALFSRHARRFMLSRRGKETKLHIDRAYLSDTVVAVTAKGDLTVDSRGFLNGKVSVELVNPDKLQSRVPDLTEDQQKVLTALQGAITAFGRTGETEKGEPTKTITLTFDTGSVRAGLIPLGHIPSIYRARR